jgi:hypothetical protein
MTPAEASDLLTRCAAFDNRQPSAAAAIAWASSLNDIPLDRDAFAAVDRFYGTPARPGERLWIQPHDVRTHRKILRAERLENFAYEPPPGLDDPDFVKRLRAQQRAVGSGTRPAPAHAPALTGGPHKAVANKLAGIGREVPDEDIDAVRRPGPLGAECPKCKAAIGRPCRTPGGKERPVHPGRRGETTDPEAEKAEIERRRAASAAALRRMQGADS